MQQHALSLLVVVVVAVMGELQPPGSSYKILMLLPVSSKSHRNVFMPVAEALADRGHKVVMLTNHPPASKHPNVLETMHGLPYFREEHKRMFTLREGNSYMDFLAKILPLVARDIYKVPQVNELYARRKEFDLIIVDHNFNEVMYPFVHEIPFITICTSGMDFRVSAVLGNVMNPAYVEHRRPIPSINMSVWQRFMNLVSGIVFAFSYRSWKVVPLIQKEITAQFPDLPPLLELESNLSLSLLNTHFTIDTTKPLLPSQIEIAATHCRSPKPLPQDLEEWISGAGPEGVIYFSLGTYALGTSMPVQYRDTFMEAFRRLPHRVIWKYEEELEGAPDNVLMKEWLPQQDILARNEVKLFISHGGLLGIQEAVYHRKPLLSIPIFGDQTRNAQIVRLFGFGERMDWEDVTAENLVKTVTKIIGSPKYRENIGRASVALRDQITTPLERAVYWSEYVIRHRGAPQLKCPAAALSWVEYLMFDVVAIVCVAVYVLCRVVTAVVRCFLFSSGGKAKMKWE